MRKRILFHLHTHCSVDSNLEPLEVVNFARENNIDVLAPTDHNTIRGSLQIKFIAEEFGIETIIGAEFSSDHGDIIGLFLHDDIYARSALDIIKEIHEQGGLAILPHPYKAHHLTDDFLNAFDGVEVFNARLPEQLNRLAAELASELKLPVFYGADAHVRNELGLVVAELEYKAGQTTREAITHGLLPVRLSNTTPAMIYRSKMLASARRGTPVRYLHSMVKMLSARLKGATL